MENESEILSVLERLEAVARNMSLRQEALIAAIDKQTSVVDTTNELISKLIAWPDEGAGSDTHPRE
jgi:hypothetical protein